MHALRITLAAALIATVPANADDSMTSDGISLELIMQDPAWLGYQPLSAYWDDNGKAIYFSQKIANENFLQHFMIDVDSGAIQELELAALAEIPGYGDNYNSDRSQRVFARDGDIFISDKNGVRQLTRTADTESSPFFLADDTRVAWKNNSQFYTFHLDTGTLQQVLNIEMADDPNADKPGFDYLKDQQTRLFDTLREEKARSDRKSEHELLARRSDPSRLDPTIYLGADRSLYSSSLAPNARWIIAITKPRNHDSGKHDSMADFVTSSGYIENKSVRELVGLNEPAPHSLHLINVESGEVSELDLARLPGIKDDPLRNLRDSAIEYHIGQGGDADAVKRALKAPAQRTVEVEGIEWSRDGSQVAIQLHSIDNKDRWIATVDFSRKRLDTQHRLTDNAWINWYMNEFGWLPDNETLWYLSEETGYSHLYVKKPGSRSRALTQGEWEATKPIVNAAGTEIYFAANRERPGFHNIHRVNIASGAIEQLTTIGVESDDRKDSDDKTPLFSLSPDETRLLFKHDEMNRPPELYLQAIGGEPRKLTSTVSEDFLKQDWKKPEIVEVPSSHIKRPIHSRVYTPEDFDPSKKYPAVMFVHGAGYLHNAHEGWSDYFREFMFHNLLVRHGYVVIDMDYRASAGYGRDWRTAIYRQMGHPELEDMLDGVDWLVKNRSVDPARVGVYGGSYGGFMTFMALFRAPGKFAAGAALRPVTDWVHYNHGYTANILNTPLVDPLAYEKSSPIEFAEQYPNTPMLIAHGMQDDNVFFKDSVRLVQRLLELHKENYTIAPYPMDPHSFKHADSWLDEYRRIFKLFEENLK